MRLKSLELQGFKSFPDRTKLNFDTGMTVVIGPNGSGKSNIADAIRWVLGEISSKNIRGSKMEDVIFGGTDNRRPMGYAEVSLTFDNTLGEIALPVDYDEVTVTRKYYRSGDSEYMINGQNVRLRDINELFMNTGLGRSGYSIIGQGRISEIISKKSEDRRGIFEEAAGISKYRYKKSEAERKLEKTDDNLSRVTDILSELEGRVGPLERDAEKARKYLELYAEKKEADVSLWLYEIDSVRRRSEKLQERYEISKHELEMAEDSLQSLDKQTERLFARMRENQEKSENAHKESGKLTEEKHQADAAFLLSERDEEHLGRESIRLDEEIKKKNEEGKGALVRLSDLQNSKKETEKSLGDIEKSLAAKQEQIEATRSEIGALASARDRAEEEVENSKDALQALRLELSTLEGSKTSEAQRKEELEGELAQRSERMKKSGEELLRAEENLREYQNKLASVREKLDQIHWEIERTEEEKTEKNGLLNQNQVLYNTVTERIRLLRRMEEHFEGYAGSVRHVMNKAADGTLQGICGPVSKLLSVEERYAVAIEITLGAGLQNIVTENEQDAKNAIGELKREGAGRATFYPLTTMRPQPLEVNYQRLSSFPGFVGIAHNLVSFDEHYRPVLEYLLCRTVICDTLDHASEISKAFSYKFKTVSLDGQVINAGGSFTGGSTKKDGGILSRGAEILRLEKELEKLKETSAALEKERESLDKKAEELRSEKDQQNQMLEILNVMYASEDTDFKVKKAKLEDDQKQKEALSKNLEALSEEMKNYHSRKAEMEERIREAVSTVASKQAETDRLSKEAQELNDRREKEIEEKNGLLLQKSAFEKDFVSSERELQKISLQISALQKEAEELSSSKTLLGQKKADCVRKKAEAEALSKALFEKIAALAEEDEWLRRENEDFEKQNAEIRLKQKEKSSHREILLKEYTKLEGNLEAIKTEQERYSSKLWDEYELTYSASKELNYPPVTEENRNETIGRQNKLRNRLRELGAVNVGAIEEYAQVKERYDALSGQYKDLTTARNELNGIISDLEKEMKLRFSQVFSEINDNFRIVFAELFGGGTAELSLTDPENVLESGIEISVAPPGKIIKSLALLSGGEQVFVAIALFFAILRVTPAPFCLLDEIEAALDEVNVARFASYAKNYSDKTQFIIISHRRGTMEQADTMYGVTMSERGISKVLPLHLNEVEAKTGLKV